MFSSTRARLTAYFTVLFGAIVVALAIAGYLLIRNKLYAEVDSGLRVAVDATALSATHELNEHSAQAAGDEDLQSVITGRSDAELNGTQIVVKQGSRIVAYSGTEKGTIDLRSIDTSSINKPRTVAGLRVAARNLAIPKFHTRYRIYSATSVEPTLEQLNEVRLWLLILVPLGLTAAGVLGYRLAKQSLAPLQELTETIANVSSADLSARVKLAGVDTDIGQLGHRFNELLDRLERAFRLQRQFMADASHELRTPVTVALAASQVTIRDHNRTMQDCEEALKMIEEQGLVLTKIIDDMLFLSQMDAAALRLDCREMFLDDVIAEASRAGRALARKKQQTFELEPLPEAKCLGDHDLLRRAILILLDNAVKFAGFGGHIGVQVERRGECWVCSVTDDGPGMPPEAQAHIFERFFRAELQGEKKQSGSGLGLSIARTIVEGHQGTLTLVESRPGCTRFELAIRALVSEQPEPVPVQAKSLAVKI